MAEKKTITVFTPTFNRAHTLHRTYESLISQTCKDFVWLVVDDGSTDETESLVNEWINEKKVPIKYIKKENGGLHTGYNTAIEQIDTELCVCIDSDDWMPVDAIEKIVSIWTKEKSPKLAGIIGLDFYADTQKPVGGLFKDISKTYHFLDITYKLKHYGDIKMILRTDLLKQHVPMISFPDEKNFNPIYLFYQIDANLEYVLINTNLCFVDYQQSGMSANIFKQYRNSPYSFAEIRKASLKHPRVPFKRKFIDSVHLVSSSLIAKDLKIAKSSSKKFLIFLALPFGLMLYLYILYKTRNK